MRSYNTTADRIFLLTVYTIWMVYMILTLYPFWDIVVVSISTGGDSLRMGFHLYTDQPSLLTYIELFRSPEILKGLYNTMLRVMGGTTLSILVTILTAYPLSRKSLPMNRLLTGLLAFTFIFQGGLIPTYLVMKGLHLTDTIWGLILPTAANAYNIIILRSFFQAVPESLLEAARIDGASQMRICWGMVVPLSMPVIVATAIWTAVAHWNEYLNALIYITDGSKIVLQVVLRRILLENQVSLFLSGKAEESIQARPTEETVKAAAIVISILPVLFLYPVYHKFFRKGLILGGIKE